MHRLLLCLALKQLQLAHSFRVLRPHLVHTSSSSTRKGIEMALLPKIYSTLDEVELHFQDQSSQSSDIQLNNSIDQSSIEDTKQQQLHLPHLFLHFDVNETILIGDPAGGDTVTECLNKIIAKSAFVCASSDGADGNNSSAEAGESNNYGDAKEATSNRGLKRSPSSGNITPSSTHNIHPTHWWNGQSISQTFESDPPPLYTGWAWPPNTCPYYRTSYKKLAKEFTKEGNHGRIYRPLYEKMCHKLGLVIDEAANNNSQDTNIFANFVPAFFHTLQYYFPSKSSRVESTATTNSQTTKHNRYMPPPPKVTLVLRTFGTDLPRVARCISEFAKGNHPSYPDYYNPDLILDGDVFCSSWTYRDVHGNAVKDPDENNSELVYELHSTTKDEVGEHSQNRIRQGDHTGDDSILNYIETKTIVGIQDCYPFWSSNNHAPWAGKPVWARTNTHSFSKHDHHHILLDDNIHNDPNDGAGGIRIPKAELGEGVERHTSYKSLHGEEALNMHGKHLIRVPTVCPLMDDDWFVRKIEEARWKYFEEDMMGKLSDLAHYVDDDALDLSDKNLSDEDFVGRRAFSPSIQSIDLSRNRLKHIPAQIFSLSMLTHLDISRNSVEGIPLDIKELPNLSKLVALSNHLRMRQISLDGLASLANLKLLDLRYNRKLKQSALDTLEDALLPNNPQLKVLCTVPKTTQAANTKLSACDRDATLLRSQLEPISTPQLCKRLERTFGITLNKQSEEAYNREFIMRALLECYSKHGPREIRKEQGILVSHERQAALLEQLKAVNWPRTTRERPKIRAEYYMILQKPGSGKAGSKRTKAETAKLTRYQVLFDLAVETLAEIDPMFADRFTALAVTKNFVGSPHIDTLNVGPFYGISLGDFTKGGAIAVECSPLLVAEIETKGRLGKVDGRFPHWVTPYVGTRYSLIYYVTSGIVQPQTTAIFAPPSELGVDANWVPPPAFVP